MWAVWLFLLVALLTPFFGRIWCTICPLPFFGDLIQRKSAFTPGLGSRGVYRNKFSGLFRKWPHWLQNGWPKLIVLLTLTTFSTTLVANPKVTGITVLLLIIAPTLMSVFFELRAFCRYLCPVSVFVGPFSRMSPLALRNKSQQVCDRCTTHYCLVGSQKGWACPYGINVGELNENTDCGLCLECIRSCLYNNVTLYARPFGTELGTKSLSEALTIISVFTLAAVYSILYQGHYPVIRDFVNILDKEISAVSGDTLGISIRIENPNEYSVCLDCPCDIPPYLVAAFQYEQRKWYFSRMVEEPEQSEYEPGETREFEVKIPVNAPPGQYHMRISYTSKYLYPGINGRALKCEITDPAGRN